MDKAKNGADDIFYLGDFCFYIMVYPTLESEKNYFQVSISNATLELESPIRN